MALYLKYGDIKGPVTTKGFEGWIECESFSWQTRREIGTAARGSTSREHSEPQIDDITVTKRTDIATPKLFLESVSGKLNTKVDIKFTTTDSPPLTYLALKLENVGLSLYSMTSHGHGASGQPGMPEEMLTLNFTKVTETFTGHDPGLGGSPETVGYDKTTMTKL
jgi:type VI secretion system secreted protein Hcp